MFDVELVSKLWPIFLGLIALVVWCVRLEAEVRYLRKDHEEHKRTQEDKDQAVWKKIDYFQLTMNDVAKTVSRIEGLLEHKKD